MSPSITVVVPVYGSPDDTRRCIESVLRHAPTVRVGFELFVIDDASPDPAVRDYVDRLTGVATDLRVRVARNEANLGFVATCNRAFRETAGDVVLLNSDTVVTDGWLDRLHAAAGGHDVATVTPLTNFGSLCTLPRSVIDAFALDGPEPRIDECAAFVAANSLEHRPEVISGVGFCMYVTRTSIDAVGLFDEEAFGHGYGEEVDFCLRASSAGLRHVVDDSTFVYHRGAGSFSEQRESLLKASSQLIHERYPYFRTMNLRERADDPLRRTFASLELGLEERKPDRHHVLQVLHSKPGELGGTEKHLSRLIDALTDEFDVSIFQPSDHGYLLTTLFGTGAGAPTRREYLVPGGHARGASVDDPSAAAALETALDMFDFDAVHIQNIVHHSLAPLRVLRDFDGPVTCSVRDLYLACPHHWLLYRNTQSCGIPDDLSYCARCLPETRGLDRRDLERFRQTVADRLDAVDHWVFASQSAADFFRRVYDPDPDRVHMIEHGTMIEPRRVGRAVDEARILDEPLRIAYVGIGWTKKGLPALNALAERFRGTTVELHLFGELREAADPEIHVHGRYDNEVLPELLDRAGIQIVFLPGPFVETFGHVLTESVIAGRPAIVNRWGALGERVRRHEIGWTVDPEDVEAMGDLIERLDRCRLEVLRATHRTAGLELHSVEDTAERYAQLYRSHSRPRPDRPSRTEGRPMQEKERYQRELQAMATLNRQLQAELTTQKQRQRPAAKARSAGASSAANATSVRSSVARVRGAIAHRGVAGAARAAARKGVRRARRTRGVIARRGLAGTGREAARRLARR
jgi:GT2 family glycosyltransferase